MQSWLKSLLGSGELTELPEELNQLLAQAKRDKRALRDLLKRLETASKRIEGLGEIDAVRAAIESLDSQMGELQVRATTLGDSVARLEVLEQRGEEIGRSQEALIETAERSSNAADRIENRIAKIHAQLENVSSSEKMITNLLEPNGGLTRVRAEIDQLMADVGRLEARSTDFAQMETRMDTIGGRAGDLEEDQKALARSIDSVSKRLVEADQRVAEVGEGFQSVALIRKEIEELSGPSGPLSSVRAQVERAHQESVSYGSEVDQLREDQGVVRAAQERVMSKYEDLRAKLESLDAGADKANASAARVDKAVVDLQRPRNSGPDRNGS